MKSKSAVFALIGALIAGVLWFYTHPNIGNMDLMMTIPIVLLGGMIGGLIGSFSELKAKTKNVPKAFMFTPITIFLIVAGSAFLVGGIALQSVLDIPADGLFIGGGGALFFGVAGSVNLRADR